MSINSAALPEREKEIPGAMSALANAIEQLEACVDHLNARFEPVMRVFPDGDENKTVNCDTKLGTEICINVDRIQKINQRIRDMVDRCEL